MKKLYSLVVLSVIVVVFFWQMFFKGLLPIPSDTIAGLYYPFREAYFKTNPNGLPYKNFLITDPVRQQYPWRNLAIDILKKGEIPSWNPYNFAGTPLIGNFQSSVFYPLNFLFLILPFSVSWSIMIFLGPLLAGIFMYLYLDSLNLKKSASILGSITFAFSGFFVAWFEWGTIIQTSLWLPLIFLSIDKIFIYTSKKDKRNIVIWSSVFIVANTFSFFAGYLQAFFYIILLSLSYIVVRLVQNKKKLKPLLFFIICFISLAILTFVQWYPTLKFILLSARDVDVGNYKMVGWFIPWQNVIQFIVPDFFGNPATLNYWGIWNYGEFIGYVGIVPLIFSLLSMVFRKDKKSVFFTLVLILSLILAFPTIFAKIPFHFNLPFISTAQPTRLLFIVDFALAVLSALGFDYFIKSENKKRFLFILILFSSVFIIVWTFILFFGANFISQTNLPVAKQNLIFPSVLFVISLIVFILMVFLGERQLSKFKLFNILMPLLILLTIVDLFRFGWKFESFTNQKFLYPSSSITSFLQNQKGIFRVMPTDSKILPPNFSIMYKIQTLDGYDPLYLRRYGDLMAAIGRSAPNIDTPFGFNRIITPQDYKSNLINFLNVKYVLSLENISDVKFKKVFTDGYVNVYENLQVMPRTFFAINSYVAKDKQDAINSIFDKNYKPVDRATVENVPDKSMFNTKISKGTAEIVEYSENLVKITTQNGGDGFLVLTDSFYPTWHATVDGKETRIFLTDLNFRGIFVPKGKHQVIFYDKLF